MVFLGLGHIQGIAITLSGRFPEREAMDEDAIPWKSRVEDWQDPNVPADTIMCGTLPRVQPCLAEAALKIFMG